MKNPVFESERINFIRVSEDLAPEYLEMINDPEIQRLINHTSPNLTLENEIGWAKEHLKNNDPIFSMVEKSTGDFIGNVELKEIHDGIGEIGISITSKMQDNHYGQEALKAFIDYLFKNFELKNIELTVFDFNERAKHVYEKIGFTEDSRDGNKIHMIYNK